MKQHAVVHSVKFLDIWGAERASATVVSHPKFSVGEKITTSRVIEKSLNGFETENTIYLEIDPLRRIEQDDFEDLDHANFYWDAEDWF
jgi:hypothetical protein